jgi:dipeptidase E
MLANDVIAAGIVNRRNLLLLGNSRNEGQAFLGHAINLIDELFADVKRLLLVPYACPPASGAVRNAVEFFQKRAIHAEVALDESSVTEQLLNADGVFILGGNTFRLLLHLHSNGLIDALRSTAAQGIPIMGASAGSNVMCPTICTTNDMPILEPPTLTSLGLIPFQVNTHYVESEYYIDDFTGENRQERLEEFVSETKRSVLALPEGLSLRVRAEDYELFGEKRAVLFSSDGKIDEVASGHLSEHVVSQLQR